MKSWRVLVALLAASLIELGAASSARAEGSDAIAAESLFDEGRRLMKAERYAEACGKFEASQKLDPGVGTLLNLADCLERTGRFASAWVRFREAASAALSAGQRDRESIARARAAAVEGMLVRLVVAPSKDAERTAGFAVTRDGVLLARDAWGSPLPLDPGRHELRATAPGKRAWTSEIVVDESNGGTTRSVVIPALETDPDAATTSPTSTQRTASYVAGGIGVAALATSLGLALGAKGSYDTAAESCAAAGCSSAARDDAASAGRMADAATGTLIGGAIALGIGVVLFVTAPRASVTGANRAASADGIRF